LDVWLLLTEEETEEELNKKKEEVKKLDSKLSRIQQLYNKLKNKD